MSSKPVCCKARCGVIVLINDSQPDSLSRIVEGRNQHRDPGEADVPELRDYGIGAQILAELGVHEMILLTNTTYTPVALAGYGLTIIGQRPLPGLV